VSHANARLNAHGRWLLVQRIRMQGRPGEARRGLRRGASDAGHSANHSLIGAGWRGLGAGMLSPR